jgi:transposase
MTQTNTGVAGIDTSKAKLDVAIYGTAKVEQVENTPAGFAALTARLRKAGVGRVGIEASGAYERDVTRHLRAAGFEVIVLQPLQVKAVAKLRLQRAKNDKIDAALIATCAALIDAPRPAPDERLAALAQDLTYIEQIEKHIACLKTQREHATERQRIMIDADIKAYKARQRAELKRIGGLLREHPDLAERLALVSSIPGIAERTAVALVVRMPELGRISREEAAALAGLAPFDHDSGSHHGQRAIAGGRARLRRSLYAAAQMAAFRWNPALKDLYRRLTSKGKPHKVAMVACARKLLIYANTVVERGTPWVTDPAAA